jgi:hypothetical protein
MSTDRQSINKIIAHWFNGTIQPYEQEILEQWLLQLKNREFFDEITREGVLLTELKIFYEASQRAGIINGYSGNIRRKKLCRYRFLDGRNMLLLLLV